MSYTEALERLLGELQKLNAKVDGLDERLRGLEESRAGAAPPSAPADSSADSPLLREGTFGPMVQRSDPSRHQRAVSQAKALNGAPAEPAPPEPEPRPTEDEAEPASSSPARDGHQRALERIRQMQGAPPSVPEAAESPAEEPEGVRWETADADAEPAQSDLDLSAAIAVDLASRATQD